MSLWAQQNLTAGRAGAGRRRRRSRRRRPRSTQRPPILKEPLLFPYTQGLTLALGAYQTSAQLRGVDALCANPPDTTEQVLHPDKLASREPPVAVAFPADLADAAGRRAGRSSLQDTLGELLARHPDARPATPQAGTDAGRRLGRRPRRARRGPGRRHGRGRGHGLGHRRRAAGTQRSAELQQLRRAMLKAAGQARRGAAPVRRSRVVLVSGATRDADRSSTGSRTLLRSGRLTGATCGARRRSGRAAGGPGLHRLGRRDPQQAERVRQRRLRRQRQREAPRRPLRLGRRPRPARRGRRRGTASRARSRRP